MQARAHWFLTGRLGTFGKLNPCSICRGPGSPGSSLCDVSGRQPGGAPGASMGTGEGGGRDNARATEPWLRQPPEPAGALSEAGPAALSPPGRPRTLVTRHPPNSGLRWGLAQGGDPVAGVQWHMAPRNSLRVLAKVCRVPFLPLLAIICFSYCYIDLSRQLPAPSTSAWGRPLSPPPGLQVLPAS